MRPIIGISCSRQVGGAWGLYSPGHFMDYTFDEYSRAVLHCGGAPVLIPVAQNEESLGGILERLDGIVLSGGPDIHPRCYGENPLPGLGEIDAGLDVTELAIARRALDADLPVLAICRGIQLLNVCLGGTLYQDIPSQVTNSLCHQQKADKGTLSHTVEVAAGSLLHDLLKTDRIWVNGRHHQALKEVAPELRVNGRAPDGIIEAVDYPAKRFVLGVQWHPEGTWERDPCAEALFAALVAASGKA